MNKQAEEAKGAPPVEAKPEPEVGTMRNGDYMIHVYIQEGKQFKQEKSETSTPMIQITVSGKTKYSTSKTDVARQSTVYWGEHLFFEKNNASRNDIEATQIQIRVLNKGVFKDDLIGAYDFDVTYVYFLEKHTMFNTWIGLSNPEGKDFNEITCYLKLGISITGPGDDQVALNDTTGPVGEDQEVMMPPSIKKVYKQLKIRFIKGERFPKMDTLGTIDAYIKTEYLKKKLVTEAVTQTKNTHETFIEQEFWLPIQWPLASDRLVLKVFDKDTVKDEIVGSMFFSLKNMINEAGDRGSLKWFNLYGSPIGCRGENTKKMNMYPEFASTWKGRILIHTSCIDTKNPEMKVSRLDEEFKQLLAKTRAFDIHEFEIMAEIGGGICLPGKKKYSVKIQINDFVFKTGPAVYQKGNYNRWNERFPLQVVKGPYKSIDELGRVYVYLMDGDEPICFWKGLASEFTNPDAQSRWVPLQSDQALGKVKNSWEAGMIQIKLAINHKTKNGTQDFQRFITWKKLPPKRLSSYRIRCFIFQCKDLPSADSDGSSDPYISVWNPDDKKIMTRPIDDNNNPIFFEALEVYYEFDQIPNAPPIVLNIWDKDEDILDGDDYLGRSVVFLKDAALTHDDTIPKPKWHDVRVGFLESDPPCGQMLVSFAVVEDDYTFKIPIKFLKLTEEIQYKEYNVEINVLGLRNLESIGMMPVKKPFIKFNLRSLLPPEKAQAVTNIKTQPAGTGNNPNINTVLNFSIGLPEDPLFCPKLQCDVYDYVFKGFTQPLLGTFSISIGEIMHQLREDREKQIEDSDKIIYFLKKHVKDIERVTIQAVQGANESSQIDTTAHNSRTNYNIQSRGEGPFFDMDDSRIEEMSEKSDQSISNKSFEILTNAMRQGTRRQALGNTVLFKTENRNLATALLAGLDTKVMIEKEIAKRKEKENLKKYRLDDLKKMKESGQAAYKNIQFPSYVYDDRLKIMKEDNTTAPPPTIYKKIGFDLIPPEDVSKGNKHYRRFYDDELENIQEIFPKKPFHQSDIYRGQTRGLNKGLFSWGFLAKKSDESGQATNQKIVGYFKGKLNIENEEEKEQFKINKETKVRAIIQYLKDIYFKKYGSEFRFSLSDLESFEKSQQFKQTLEDLGLERFNILSFLKEQSYQEMISRMLMVKSKCLVRLYMLEGYEFAQKDIGSYSDPYLKLRCGKKKYNERDNYQLDQPNPEFFKMYEFDIEFPGAPPLEIKAYDYDDLFGDDMIGKTIIDLDDRFFSPEWQQIEDKPIEYRSLYHPSSQVPQGTVTCWLEIHPINENPMKLAKVYDITPQPQLDYQIRLVVYDTQETPCEDAEGTSDVFIKAYLDDKEKKESDTHFRCQDGNASFNYRLLFDVKAPRTNYNLTIQVWDRDLFKSNDFIGEIQLPLQHLFEDCILTQKPIDLNKKYFSQYLKEQFKKMNNIDKKLKINFENDDSFQIETYNSEGKSTGRVRLGLNITPGDMAKANPVGCGRSEPNHSPFLGQPTGRLSFSLNPFTMLNQLVGPAMRRKIYCACCLVLCLSLIGVMIPFIASNLLSNMILSIF